MSSQEKITLVGIVLTGVYFIVRELRLTVFERRRTQPVVITHEEAMPHFAGDGWSARVKVTSDGAAPAFNVRFGIEMRGVRFAYRMEPEDDPRGNVEAVLKDGDSLPRPTTYRLAVPISSEQMWEVASLRVDGQLHEAACTGADMRTPSDRPGRHATRGDEMRSSTYAAFDSCEFASGVSSGRVCVRVAFLAG